LTADWVGAAEPESFADPTKTITAATTMALEVRRRAKSFLKRRPSS
jgi:hypothetical protein